MSESQADAVLIALASLCEAAGRRTDAAADALAEAESASPHDKAAEPEASRLQGIANDEFEQLSTPLLRMRASTLEGVFAKAKAFKLTSFPLKGVANKIEKGLEDDEGVFGPTPISLSIVRDLLVLVDQPALLTHADAAPPKDYWRRYSSLEISLRDAVVWTSLLDTTLQHIDCLSGLSERELGVVHQQLEHMITAVKKAVDHLDVLYHDRKEDART
jgi:hypothetical protein